MCCSLSRSARLLGMYLLLIFPCSLF
uniref:Uncharacterized protein n=1 Tax=Rhizophora mucronata TaxID=61149 RepID=A0A2P2KJL5_RHIMU